VDLPLPLRPTPAGICPSLSSNDSSQARSDLKRIALRYPLLAPRRGYRRPGPFHLRQERPQLEPSLEAALVAAMAAAGQ
jgi:hypothetical protein